MGGEPEAEGGEGGWESRKGEREEGGEEQTHIGGGVDVRRKRETRRQETEGNAQGQEEAGGQREGKGGEVEGTRESGERGENRPRPREEGGGRSASAAGSAASRPLLSLPSSLRHAPRPGLSSLLPPPPRSSSPGLDGIFSPGPGPAPGRGGVAGGGGKPSRTGPGDGEGPGRGPPGEGAGPAGSRAGEPGPQSREEAQAGGNRGGGKEDGGDAGRKRRGRRAAEAGRGWRAVGGGGARLSPARALPTETPSPRRWSCGAVSLRRGRGMGPGTRTPGSLGGGGSRGAWISGFLEEEGAGNPDSRILGGGDWGPGFRDPGGGAGEEHLLVSIGRREMGLG